MRRRIAEGEYAEDEMLPDQIALAEEFGVSRMTLKKAIDMIAMEGMIFRKRGVGTFVIKSALWNSGDSKADEYAGLSKQFPNKTVKSKIILFDIMFPPKTIQALLMLEDNQPVYHLQRLRIIDDKPYILENTYFVAGLVKDLTEDIIHHSIYDHIRIRENEIGAPTEKSTPTDPMNWIGKNWSAINIPRSLKWSKSFISQTGLLSNTRLPAAASIRVPTPSPILLNNSKSRTGSLSPERNLGNRGRLSS